MESEENYLDLVLSRHITLRERFMARMISYGKPQSVELQILFGSPEELPASRSGPSEQRIEGEIHLT